MPHIDIVSGKPAFLPLNVPKEYIDKLKTFHGNPFVWWAGQVANYVMRFSNGFKIIIQEKTEALNIQKPCVG